jgi:hypothetical protein
MNPDKPVRFWVKLHYGSKVFVVQYQIPSDVRLLLIPYIYFFISEEGLASVAGVRSGDMPHA